MKARESRPLDGPAHSQEIAAGDTRSVRATSDLSPDYEVLLRVLADLEAEVLESDDIGAYALELAFRGWAVFPLSGKSPAAPNPHPRGTVERQTCKGECGFDGHGVLDATTNVNKVAHWWSGRFAGANIGVRVPTNVVVVDIDPRHQGDESLKKLVATYEDLATTLTAYSGRNDGGRHLYFARPAGRLTSKRLGDGIDIKTDTGYVVVPPSVHPDTGARYRWEESPIVPPPPWLVDLLRVPEPPRLSRPQSIRPRVSAVLSGVGVSPADRFTRSASWADILEPHGWRCLDHDGDIDSARWLHPAATSACSATIRHGCLFVYSDNTPFEQTGADDPHGYTKFRAHAVLNHNGDLSAAARAFSGRGNR